jgi:hypothetical protein
MTTRAAILIRQLSPSDERVICGVFTEDPDKTAIEKAEAWEEAFKSRFVEFRKATFTNRWCGPESCARPVIQSGVL